MASIDCFPPRPQDPFLLHYAINLIKYSHYLNHNNKPVIIKPIILKLYEFCETNAYENMRNYKKITLDISHLVNMSNNLIKNGIISEEIIREVIRKRNIYNESYMYKL